MKELLLSRKARFVKYVVACLMFIVGDVLQALIMAMIFQTIEVGTMEYFWITVAAAIGYVVVSAGFFLGSRMMRIAFMRDTLIDIRVRAFDRILNMNYKGFNRQSREVYVSNLSNDINTIENSFFLSLLNFILTCGSYVVMLTILFFVDWRIGLMVFAVSLVVLGIAKAFERRTIALEKEKSTENERFTVAVANTFSGLEILKLNNIERKFLSRAKEQVARLEGSKRKYSLYTAVQRHLNEAIGSIVMFGLLIYLMYSPGEPIGFGKVVLVIQLASSCVFPLMRMLPLLNVIKGSDAIYRKITTASPDDAESDARVVPYRFERDIAVRALQFEYEQKPVFRYLDFRIEKGKKYLIKGPSGSGKTTLLKLLSMAYDDYRGTIAIDGVDLRTIRTKAYSENVSFIYQDVFLFEASVRDNIALFKDTPAEHVLEVAEKAGLGDFIRSQPHGIDEPIAENGKNLSGGERQRISIARALCKNAEILFSDEATASLNDELGRAVEETILSLSATVIAISHKYFPGVSERYDRVLELKDGYVNEYSAVDYFAEVTVDETAN
ncbi:MAG: ABC transporter ATP-binding protein [Candidatus Izemoplasmatales bacterium]